MKNLAKQLFSTRMAGLYMLLVAIAIGVATFIENDYGTSSAQKLVFRATWFELLLLLFSITLVYNIYRYRMIQNKKWSILTFHVAILVILLGSAITRYFGYEGMMHIRENTASNEFLSAESYLKFEVETDDQLYSFDKQMLFSTLGDNTWSESFQLGDEKLDVEVLGFVPNPGQVLEEAPDGKPTLQIVSTSGGERKEYYLGHEDMINIGGILFNFGLPNNPAAVNLYYRNDSLLINTAFPMQQMVMATQQQNPVAAGKDQMLVLRSLYSSDRVNFVVSDFKPSAKRKMVSTGMKLESNNFGAAHVRLTSNDSQVKETYVIGQKSVEGKPVSVDFPGMDVRVSYGAKKIQLPFAIQLHDFIMDRYPGTDNPSSFASEVTVIHPEKDVNMDYRIYMNNILDYGGYRFFQSSYDKDEKGTYLSVNHDFWGTWVSYLGYFLLTLGMIVMFFSKKSRFHELSSRLKRIREKKPVPAATAILLFALMLPVQSSQAEGEFIDFQAKEISDAHAEKFGRLLVQDFKGRIKPMNTLSSELLRKISRKESFDGMSSDHVILGMLVYPEDWAALPMIKLGKNERINEVLGVEDKYAAYNDFFLENGMYKLTDLVKEAHAKKPIDRGTFEKELIKIDERLNICNMIFTGRLLRIFPVENDPNDTWVSPRETGHIHAEGEHIDLTENFFPAYRRAIWEGTKTKDFTMANQLVDELGKYQKRLSGDIIPSETKINLELFLNKARIFSRLGMYYGLLGLGALLMFFITVFNHRLQSDKVQMAFVGLLGLGFLVHTVGLGIRWYVSGHAPWSNGYESMIYIAFTTVLAGLIFARKSIGGIAATAFLASIILMVAGLSFLDPEITPLVPVLRSYWLTIHVSLEAGSYGFLMLGAIIGILNLILMSFVTKNNHPRITRTVKEMTYISEMTLIGGLVMVSVGTYLGGVWANESWGRYWGWDAKETWALVTILVYAFILHMRFIPGLRGNYAFNVASLFGFASVIMTYFGVNYYLSGLHSYAAGDPIPIPSWVYYTAIAFFVISVVAFIRQYMVKKALAEA